MSASAEPWFAVLVDVAVDVKLDCQKWRLQVISRYPAPVDFGGSLSAPFSPVKTSRGSLIWAPSADVPLTGGADIFP